MVVSKKSQGRQFAILAALLMATASISAQETDRPPASGDRVVANDRVAVLPLWYQEEVTVGKNLSATVQETIQFLLRFLPNYELVDSSAYPSGQSALGSFGAENDLDTIIFGRINRDGREITVSLLLYDTESDQIVEVKQDVALSMLEIFDLTDRLALEILESYIGRPLEFGTLVFEPAGQPPDRYRVYINDILVGENLDHFARFLAGHYSVRIDQVVSEYNVETIFDAEIDVEEGETTTASFSRADIGEFRVAIEGPKLPVTLVTEEIELTVTDGDRVLLPLGEYIFSASQPDYRGVAYPLDPVNLTIETGTDNALTISTIELGRGFQVVPRRRRGPDSVAPADLSHGGSYTVFLDGEPIESGVVDVLPLGTYTITVEQLVEGSPQTVLKRTVTNDSDEQTTVVFPLFPSKERLESYRLNREPDISVVVQGLDGNYLQFGIRYEGLQRRIGATLLGGFYTHNGDVHTTGKAKLHWLPRGGGSRWTPEFGAIGVVDLGPDSPVISVGPQAGVSWNFNTSLLESVFIENELRYGFGRDFLLIYFFAVGVRLF